jgi:hypothetical protein
MLFFWNCVAFAYTSQRRCNMTFAEQLTAGHAERRSCELTCSANMALPGVSEENTQFFHDNVSRTRYKPSK